MFLLSPCVWAHSRSFLSHISTSEWALYLTWVTAPWAHPSIFRLHFSPSPWPLLWQPLLPHSTVPFLWTLFAGLDCFLFYSSGTRPECPPWGRLGCQVEMRLCSHVSSGNDTGDAKSLSSFPWFHFALLSMWWMASVSHARQASMVFHGKKVLIHFGLWGNGCLQLLKEDLAVKWNCCMSVQFSSVSTEHWDMEVLTCEGAIHGTLLLICKDHTYWYCSVH